MPSELMLCVPGPWRDREEFLRAVIMTEPVGQYLYAGLILADVTAKENITAEWYPKDANVDMRGAFEIAGGGKLSEETLNLIQNYESVVYLRFPLPVTLQATSIVKFSQLLKSLGGYAVKVESSGVAHEWASWETLLASQDPFDWYVALVTLIGNSSFYYSCGMHHFDEAEAEIPSSFPPAEGARLLNNFNLYRLTENPNLDNGHTLSLGQNSRNFEMQLHADANHEEDDLFYNPHGVWRLTPR
jgi:hypothetical protein